MQFRQFTEQCYKNYRELTQLIDFAYLEVQSLQYSTKTLVAAFMYLVLGRKVGRFTEKAITREVPHSSQYLFEDFTGFNDYFA